MNPGIKKMVREPLFHFMGIGILFFVVHGLVSEGEEPWLGSGIEVTRRDVLRLNRYWASEWNRTPTAEELRSVVEDFVREEVYYREAMAMGLEKDDLIIRGRLVQKMEFYSRDLVMPVEATEAELREYFALNIEDYRTPTQLTFTHIFFNSGRRGEDVAEAEARRVLSAGPATDPGEPGPSEMGDRFTLRFDYRLATFEQVSRLFGEELAAALFERQVSDGWFGPVGSQYGSHLLRITDRIESALPSFDDVLDEVRRDYARVWRDRQNDEFYASLKSRYHIRIAEDAFEVGDAR